MFFLALLTQPTPVGGGPRADRDLRLQAAQTAHGATAQTVFKTVAFVRSATLQTNRGAARSWPEATISQSGTTKGRLEEVNDAEELDIYAGRNLSPRCSARFHAFMRRLAGRADSQVDPPAPPRWRGPGQGRSTPSAARRVQAFAR